MPAVIFTMLIVLGVAAGIIAVVVMGIEGTGRSRHPEIADAMARTARHLNGEGRPPKGLTQLFDEIDDVSASDFHPRQIPGRLKSSIASVRSAVSARSATSARSAASAPELDLITVPPVAAPASPPNRPAGTETTVEPEGLVAAAIAAASDEGASPWAPPADAAEPGDLEADLAQALQTPASEITFDDPYGVSGASPSDTDFDDPYGVLGTARSEIGDSRG